MQDSLIMVVVNGCKYFTADLIEVIDLERGRIKASTLLKKYADLTYMIDEDTRVRYADLWKDRRHLELLTDKARNYRCNTLRRAVWMEGRRKKSAFKIADRFWESRIGVPFMFNDEFYLVPSGDAQAFVIGYMSFSEVAKEEAEFVEFKNYVLV